MNILVVDDDRSSLENIKKIVNELLPDSQVSAFDSSLNVLAKAREEEFDVAFLDINMPELNGIDLGNYLVELNPFINIIFLTEHREFGYEAMQIHASGYIVKPASRQAVKKELNELRYPELRKKYKRVFAQTFGNFELFADGEPIVQGCADGRFVQDPAGYCRIRACDRERESVRQEAGAVVAAAPEGPAAVEEDGSTVLSEGEDLGAGIPVQTIRRGAAGPNAEQRRVGGGAVFHIAEAALRTVVAAVQPQKAPDPIPLPRRDLHGRIMHRMLLSLAVRRI